MRSIGWEDRLSEYVDSKRSIPFEWGVNDCVKYTLLGIKKCFDIDVLQIMPQWATEEEAKEAIRLFSNDGDLYAVAEIALPQFGFIKRPLSFASRGDIIVLDTAHGPMFSLCVGSKTCTPGKNKLEFLPLSGRCWHYKG